MVMVSSLNAVLALEHTHRSALSLYPHMADIILHTPVIGGDGDSRKLRLSNLLS